jgi:hypothetical protein
MPGAVVTAQGGEAPRTPDPRYPDIVAGGVTHQHPGTMADFRAREYVQPPKTEDFNPNLTSAQQGEFAALSRGIEKRNAILQAGGVPLAQQSQEARDIAVAREDLQAKIQAATQAKAAAAAANQTKWDDKQDTQMQQRYDKRLEVYNAAAAGQQKQADAVALEQAKSVFNTQSEGARAAFETDKQRMNKTADQVPEAQNVSNILQQMKIVSAGAVPPGLVASVVNNNPKLIPYLSMAGAITPQQASDTQLFLGMANYLSTLLRPMGTGQLKIPEMDAFKSVLPTLLQKPEGRAKAAAFLQNVADRIPQEHEFMQEYFRRPGADGKPAYNLDHLGDAMVAPRRYDDNGINRGGLGPIVPHMPALEQLKTGQAAADWVKTNVDVGHPYMGWDYPRDPRSDAPMPIDPKTGQKNTPELQLMVRDQ